MKNIARFTAIAAIAGASLLAVSPAFAAATIKVAKSATIGADAAKTWGTVQNFGGLHT